MFKKKPSIKPSAPLRSSDRRKLADKIIQDFDLETGLLVGTAEEEKVEAAAARTALRNSLLPENVQVAKFNTTLGPDLKLVSGNIYIGSHTNDDPRVLWFDVQNRMLPTIYTIWHNPDMVALLHTPEIVISKVRGGADLMTPGLAAGPPFPRRAREGAIVAIASITRPSVPVAVGVCKVDISSLGSVVGAKGCAVEIKHWYDDEIWNYSSSARPSKPLPNDIPDWSQVLAANKLSDTIESVNLEDESSEEVGGVGGVAVTDPNLQYSSLKSVPNEEPNDDTNRLEEDIGANEWSQNNINAAFRSAFMYGIYNFKTRHANEPFHGLDFPLSQSFVMSNLVQPYLPTFTAEDSKQLQIKKTSWKTIRKFIKSLDKERILKSKDKDSSETIIIDIDFDDENITNFRPYRLPKKADTGTNTADKSSKQNANVDEKDDSVGQKLKVNVFHRPTSKLSALFPESAKPSLTMQEVRERVNEYIEQEQLTIEGNKRLVKLNPILANALFDGPSSVDREILTKGIIPRDALTERVLGAMNTAFSIVRADVNTTGVNPKAGSPPKIHITLETRSGNKTVTKVSGLETYHINSRLLADELRKICAGSTSVEPLAGAAKKTEKEVLEVMIQGPQLEAVVKALGKRGVDKRWIEVQDKTKGKKR